MRQYDYPRALELAKALSTQHPNDYYAHEYLGYIYAAMGKLANAEIEYKWAQQLALPTVLQAKLDQVQRQRGSAPTPLPTISPWP